MVVAFVIMMVIIYKNIGSAMERHAPAGGEREAEEGEGSNIYKEFSSFVLSVIDELKASTQEGRLQLREKTEEEAMEFYAQTIRRLMFFETMTPDSTAAKQSEEKLFAILNDIDLFLEESYEEGERLSDEIRERLQGQFQELNR
jgi:hypothetical protein